MSGVLMNDTVYDSSVDWWACPSEAPKSWQVAQRVTALGPRVVATMVIPGVFIFLMIVNFIEEAVFLVKNTTKWKVTAYKLWLLSSHPTISIFYYIQLWMPRSANVIDFTISFYFAIIVKKLFTYLLYLYGGKHGFVNALKYKKSVNGYPFPCCFCCACRRSPMTMKRVHMLQALMYHAIVFYPLMNFIDTLLRDEEVGGNFVYTVINIISIFSTFTLLYSLTIVYKPSRLALEQFNIRAKYFAIQGIIEFNTIQGTFINLADRVGIMSCKFPYPNNQPGKTTQAWLVIIELTLLSLLGRRAYRVCDDEAKVVPYPPLDEFGEPMPETAFKRDIPVKVLNHMQPDLDMSEKVGPGYVEENQFRVQIDSASTGIPDSPFVNECFVDDIMMI